jgi:hypothetical protein
MSIIDLEALDRNTKAVIHDELFIYISEQWKDDEQSWRYQIKNCKNLEDVKEVLHDIVDTLDNVFGDRW